MGAATFLFSCFSNNSTQGCFYPTFLLLFREKRKKPAEVPPFDNVSTHISASTKPISLIFEFSLTFADAFRNRVRITRADQEKTYKQTEDRQSFLVLRPTELHTEYETELPP